MIFFNRGYFLPFFFCQWFFLIFFSISMNFLMTIMAQAYQITLPLSFECIPDFQCKFRMLLYIIHMMHCRCSRILPAPPAYLTFILVQPQDFFTLGFPFTPDIKSMYIFLYALLHICNITLCPLSSYKQESQKGSCLF